MIPLTGRLFHRVESGAPGVYVIHDVDAETGAITAAWNALDNATPGMGTGVRGDRKSLLGEQPNPSDDLTTQVSGTWRMQSADGRIVTLDAKGTHPFDYSGLLVLTDKAKAKWKNDNDWAGTYERAAVDAQYYARFTDDWYLDPANVGGFDFATTACDGDDPLGQIRNVVHYNDVPGGPGYVNAFWDGFFKFMVYGDGDGVTATYMSGGQDVVSHELTHAVTQCRAPLVYNGQSGALNEAMSDIMATTMEWELDEPLSSNCRREVGQSGCPDWWVGEDVLIGGSRFGFRNIQDPAVTGQPSHWKDRCVGLGCGNDNGGVHINSTIATHAFYLLVNGGRNARCSGPTDPTADCDVLVPAIPMADATQILFSAWGLLTTSATFCDAHDVAVAQAEVLFPGSVGHHAATELAWTAVGRGEGDCHPTVSSTDFSLHLNTRSVSAAPGASVQVTATLTRGTGVNGPISYSASGGTPATITPTPAQSLVPGPDDVASVDVAVPPNMPEGVYPVLVSASDGSQTRHAAFVLVVDATAPAVSLASVRFADGGTVSASGTVPLNVTWNADDALSGVASSALESSPNGTDSWSTVSTANGGGTSAAIVGDSTQWFQVSAADAVGNAATPLLSGPWGIGPYQEIAATYKGTWSAPPPGQTWGSVRYSTAAGATAKFAFTGTDVAWVSTRAGNRGKAKVYIDGALKATVDLFSASTQARRIVFAATGLSAGPHTLKIVVSGTSGRPRVDVDGFLTLSPPTF